MSAQFPSAVWDGLSSNQLSRGDDKAPDYHDWDQIVDEVRAIQTRALSGDGSNGVVAGTGASVTETQGMVHKTTISLSALLVSIASSAIGFGSQKIYDFPDGLISVLGATMDLTITRTGTEIVAGAAVVAAVGTVAAADDATLTSTEANIIPSTAYTLVSGTKQASGVATTPALFNGTATAIDAILNLAVPDADRSDTAENLSITGTIVIHWINLGDVT